MKISTKGLALIKKEERFMPTRYLCPAGKPTIGYGHVIQPNEAYLNKARLTEAEASTMLQRDVDTEYGAHVARSLTRPVTQNQFDALVSLCYNIGTGGLSQSSVLRLANAGSTDPAAIKAAFGAWNKITNPQTKVKEVSVGLTKRRATEATLYLTK